MRLRDKNYDVRALKNRQKIREAAEEIVFLGRHVYFPRFQLAFKYHDIRALKNRQKIREAAEEIVFLGRHVYFPRF
ncbi:hypothetical protein BU202_00745 [Streptococcus cuniculi]|uniref:Uncharacterized protein n=1 Tax=Streptococcus cuniculi TaxID=1432788 RepID=A0A1Q8EAM8_9STRE|nr:hypothetical protein BU202_00745 [Streptococcus cuniculi]